MICLYNVKVFTCCPVESTHLIDGLYVLYKQDSVLVVLTGTYKGRETL